MRPSDLVLHCFAERRSSGLWVACCVDLNLAVQARNLHDAKRKLKDQMVEYVNDALVGRDAAHVSQLVPRRAPMDLMVRYYTIRVLYALRSVVRKSPRHRYAFSSPLPVQVAAAC